MAAPKPKAAPPAAARQETTTAVLFEKSIELAFPGHINIEVRIGVPGNDRGFCGGILLYSPWCML